MMGTLRGVGAERVACESDRGPQHRAYRSSFLAPFLGPPMELRGAAVALSGGRVAGWKTEGIEWS